MDVKKINVCCDYFFDRLKNKININIMQQRKLDSIIFYLKENVQIELEFMGVMKIK